MKRLVLLTATVALMFPVSSLLADPPEPANPQDARQRFMRRPDMRQRGSEDANRPSGRVAGGGMMSGKMMGGDPRQMVARLIQRFDTDGDQKLDQTELTAMLTAMRQRRGGDGNNGGPQGDRPERKRRMGNDNEGAAPGGERPRRPDAQ